MSDPALRAEHMASNKGIKGGTMKLVVTYRNLDRDEKLDQFIEKKITSLSKLISSDGFVHWVLWKEGKNRGGSNVFVKDRSREYIVSEKGERAHRTISSTIRKLKSAMRRNKMTYGGRS